ncbi:hypothetical protein ACLDZI_01380 [Acinetobacter baumannii]
MQVLQKCLVHGGIRHLEIRFIDIYLNFAVHGGIRHLEKEIFGSCKILKVHGGIRHLEISFVSQF